MRVHTASRARDLARTMDVESILATSKAQYKSIEVNKEVDLQFDLHNLVATDLNTLDAAALR